jgi:Phosphotransferase enzyme family
MVSAIARERPTRFTGQIRSGSRNLVLVRREATWMVPLDSRRVAAAGLSVYRPKSLVESLAWRAARRMAAPGLLGLRGREVGLRPEIAAAVSGRLGRSDLRFAVTVPQADRATIAAITPRGDLVAFGKLAASELAAARVEREHAALKLIAPRLPAAVQAPRVLFRDAFDDIEVLLITPIEVRRSAVPTRLGVRTPLALAELVRQERSSTLGRLLPPPAPMDGEWASLLRAARDLLTPWLDVPVQTALVHGDFVPWNVVQRRTGVAAYDWEDASLDGAPCWDLWHFAVQGGALLDRWTPQDLVLAAVRQHGPLGPPLRAYLRAARLPATLAAPVLAGYLAASASVVGRHGGLARPDRVVGMRFRARVLARLLEAWT